MPSFYIGEAEQQAFEAFTRKFITEAIRDTLLPELKDYVNDTVLKAATSIARTAITDELDYTCEKGAEIFKMAQKAGRPPSTFKDG